MDQTEAAASLDRLHGLLTPAEAAQFTRLTVGQLAQLRYLGRGPAYLNPTPRRILYRRSDLESWLSASERRSTRSR